MASWLMRMVSSSGKSSRKRRAICSGLQAVAQRRSCRRPCRRPFHGTTGPRTAAPFGAMMTPASRSCTYRRSGSLIASLAAFGRRAERSACHCAVVARYARAPLRVAALRRSSREIVDGARSSRRAISRTPCCCARQIAISSRSANDRERPDSGFDDGARWDGGMPPALRNQRAPTAGDTPAPTAASSLEHPAAMAAQNRWRSSRRATEGRPGEGKAPRPDRSERRFRTVIATSSLKGLRRPLEPGLRASVRVMDAALWWRAGADGSLQRRDRDPRLHRPADRIADHLARPGVEDGREIDEARADGDLGEIGNPEPVRPVRHEALGQIGEDRLVMVAVGGCDEASAVPRLKLVLAHQAADLLAVDDDALVAERGADAAIAVALELVADGCHAADELRVVDPLDGRVVEGGARQAHQLAPSPDRETSGPATTDVGAPFGRGLCPRPPFRNSISRACRPT